MTLAILARLSSRKVNAETSFCNMIDGVADAFKLDIATATFVYGLDLVAIGMRRSIGFEIPPVNHIPEVDLRGIDEALELHEIALAQFENGADGVVEIALRIHRLTCRDPSQLRDDVRDVASREAGLDFGEVML